MAGRRLERRARQPGFPGKACRRVASRTPAGRDWPPSRRASVARQRERDPTGVCHGAAPRERRRRAGADRRRPGCGADRVPRRRRGVVKLGPGACVGHQRTECAAGPQFAGGGRQGAILRSRPGAPLDDRAHAGIHDNIVGSPRAGPPRDGTARSSRAGTAPRSWPGTGRGPGRRRSVSRACGGSGQPQRASLNGPASTGQPQRGSWPHATRRAAGLSSIRDAASTSAIRAGMPAWPAARSARASAARATLAQIRRTAIPATTNS